MAEHRLSSRDCGVCGVGAPATFDVQVTEDGYTVPRCADHLGAPAYQAESRLADANDPQPTPQRSGGSNDSSAVEGVREALEGLRDELQARRERWDAANVARASEDAYVISLLDKLLSLPVQSEGEARGLREALAYVFEWIEKSARRDGSDYERGRAVGASKLGSSLDKLFPGLRAALASNPQPEGVVRTPDGDAGKIEQPPACETCGSEYRELCWVILHADRLPSYAALRAVGDLEEAYRCPDSFHDPVQSSGDVRRGIDLIASERDRQVAEEGYFGEHDDQHIGGEIAQAASAYAQKAANQAAQRVGGITLGGPVPIPPGADWWKPSDDPIRNLVKAGALVAAEIDRLQRALQTGEAS